MMANSPPSPRLAARRPMERVLAMTIAATTLLLVGSCAAPPPPPPQTTPAVRPSARPVTPAPGRAPAGWRDMPITPGEWGWTAASGKSTARFGAGANALVTLTCELPLREVHLARSGNAGSAVAMAVTTTSITRALSSDPAVGPAGQVVARVRSTDPLLDAMAFSRGRFALEVAGLPTLYLPSWPEVSRVVEDCR